MTSAKIEIQKSNKGWHYLTTAKYPDWPNPVCSGGGEDTLKDALWQTVLHCIDNEFAIESVTVKGKDMPLVEVCTRVEKALQDGVLKYRLPGVREALGR